MAKPTPQQCHALTTYYAKSYTDRYGSAPRINRNKARWGFESILMDLTPEDTRGLIDFYISGDYANGHDLEWFLYNYDKLQAEQEDSVAQRNRIKDLMRESRERSREWHAQGNRTFTQME